MSSLPHSDLDEQTADLPLEASPACPATETLAPSPRTFGKSATDPVAPLTSPAPEAPFPTSGSVLRGRYVLGEILGRGGAAIVYRAQDLDAPNAAGQPSEVALKLLRPDCYQRAVVIERLKNEFQLAHTIAHPNAVRIYDLDRHDSDGREIWFMTLELLIGQNLAALMASSTTPLSISRIREILVPCGNVLTFAHERNVVHGDFKPGNVFVTRNDEVRVLDFGNAHHGATETADVQRAATFCYASPEVLMGMRPTPADDVFSLACVAYELFNARHPYDRRPTLEALSAQLRPARPWSLGNRQWLALQAALSFVRDRRPSMQTLLADLFTPEKKSVAPPIVEQTVALPLMKQPAATPFAANIIRPAPVSIRRKFIERTRTRRPLAAAMLLVVVGLASLVTAWRIFGPVRFPAATEVRSSIHAPLLAMTATLGKWRSKAQQAPAGASVPLEETRPAGAAMPEVSRTSTIENPAPVVPASGLVALGATQQIAAPPTRRTEPVTYVAFADLDIRVGEQTSAATVGIKRSSNLSGNSSVRWKTVPGTARANEDFVSAEGSINFPEGLDFRILYIPLVNDQQPENDEQFRVEIYDPSARTLIGPQAETQVIIADDD